MEMFFPVALIKCLIFTLFIRSDSREDFEVRSMFEDFKWEEMEAQF
jgi:hypothetical protein